MSLTPFDPQEPNVFDDDDEYDTEAYWTFYHHRDRIKELLTQHFVNLAKEAFRHKYGYYLTPAEFAMYQLGSYADRAVDRVAPPTTTTEMTLSEEVDFRWSKPVTVETTVTQAFLLDLFAAGKVPPVEDPLLGVRQLYPCEYRGCPHWLPEDDDNISGVETTFATFFNPKRSSIMDSQCSVAGCTQDFSSYVDNRPLDDHKLMIEKAWYAQHVSEGEPDYVLQQTQNRIDEITRDQARYLKPEPVLVSLASLRPPQLPASATIAPAAASRMTNPSRDLTAPVLGQDITSGESVVVADEDRTRHIAVIGATGRGKTTLLEHLIIEDLRTGTSAVVIDPFSDLTRRIITLADEEQRERIILLEEWPERPFRLNLLACPNPDKIDRTVNGVVTTFRRLFDEGSQQPAHRLRRYLGNALRTLLPNDRTLADVPRLFWDDSFRAEMLSGVRSRKVHDFWMLFDALPRNERVIQLESTINRLDEFLASDAAHTMVDSTVTSVPFDSVLNEDGHLLILHVSIDDLGEQQAQFYGALFLSVLTDRLFGRAKLPNNQRHRLHLYLDEYGFFATPTTASLLQRARKYNVGATIAVQTLDDLPDAKNRQALLQTGTKIVVQVTGQDADELAPNFPVRPRAEEDLKVPEIEGTEPILGPVPDPIGHLLRAGHSNHEVRALVRDFLLPLSEAAKLEEENERQALSAASRLLTDVQLTREISDKTVRTGLEKINRFLTEVMEDPHFTDDELRARTTDIFAGLGPYYGIFDRFSTVRTKFAEKLSWALYSVSRTTREWLKDVRLVPASPHSEMLLDATGTARRICEEDAAFRLRFKHSREPSDEIARKTAQAFQQIDTGIRHLSDDAEQFILLCRHLSKEPILGPTGQEKPRMRDRHVMHSAQSQQDARAELSGALANLAPFTALYKTWTSDGFVKLAEGLDDGCTDEDEIEGIVEAIRERCRQTYGIPLDTPGAPKKEQAPSSPTPRPPRIRRTPEDES